MHLKPKQLFSIGLLIFFLGFSNHLYAQREANIWYFGNKAGLNFNGGNPVPLPNSKMLAPEGSSSIANSAGNFLFYTNGKTVWDRTHNIMTNGTNLFGSDSSTQSSLIIPKPPFNVPGNQFYIFTIDQEAGANGIRYSEVDVSTGNGTVTSKNSPLASNVTEKVAAVVHQNNQDIWLIAHGWGNNRFMSYRVTPSGVSFPPINSNIGTPHAGSIENTKGYMKASTDGKRIAIALPETNIVEVFNFDLVTGLLTNVIKLDLNGSGHTGAYGVEFSPNGNRLYVSTSSKAIFQFNLNLPSEASINSSRAIVGMTTEQPGALQAGPDGRIYISKLKSRYLGVIELPNFDATNASFKDNGVNLINRRCELGLPNFIQSYFAFKGDFTSQNQCANDSTLFTPQSNVPADSWIWDFDDPVSGTANTSTLAQPKHSYSAPGNYNVRLIIGKNDLRDTVVRSITIKPTPTVYLGEDSILCDGEKLTLDAGNVGSGANYYWNTVGGSVQTVEADKSGRYIVEVDISSCISSDTIDLVFLPVPEIDLGPDTSLCDGATFDIKANNSVAGSFKYLWSTNDTIPDITVGIPDTYWLVANNGRCSDSDAVIVSYQPPPVFSLGRDTAFCQDTITLDPKIDGVTYQWNDNGPTTKTIDVWQSGVYKLKVAQGKCEAEDSIRITVHSYPTATIDATTLVICETQNETATLTAGNHDSYQWFPNGETTSSIEATEAGEYRVVVANPFGCSDSETITVESLCPTSLYIPTSFSPNGDNTNETFQAVVNNVTNFQLNIFNRWGEIVFSANDPDIAWDGTCTTLQCPSGLYSWIIRYTDNNKRNHTETGTVYVIR